MKHLLWKLLMLTAILCLFFVLSAQAAPVAGTTQKVGTAEELYALMVEINAEGKAVYEADKTKKMELVNVEITNDIELTGAINFGSGTNVHLYGTAGKNYKLTSKNIILFYFTATNSSLVQVSDLVVDGCGNGSSFAMFGGTNATMGPNLEIKNFKASIIHMIWCMDAGGTAVLPDVYPNNITFDGVTMKDNIAQGPANIYMYSYSGKSKMTIRNSTFDNNDTATAGQMRGGALWLENSELEIENSRLLNNKSCGGGAIIAVLSKVKIKDSLFQENNTKPYLYVDNEENERLGGDGGGALYLQKGTTAAISNTRFVNNKSFISGGAVTVYVGSEATFSDCEFISNEAVTHGGALCVCDRFDKDDSKPSKVTLNNCTLTGNKAQGNDAGDNFASSPEAAGGGAIFLHEYCEATLKGDTIFSKNESADEGGAIYASFGSRVYMESAQMEENKAATHGGAVYLDGTDAYRGYSHADDGNVPGDDDGYDGGGKFFMTDGLIYRNTAGKNGGGVYIGGENEVEVEGEILRFEGGRMEMSGGVITENQAMDMGGGIFVGSSGNEDIGGTFVMTGGTVHENIAGQDGNTSTGIDDAGAEIFSVGYTSYISVVEADKITSYIRNRSNRFVPESHRSLYYEDWYDDYSDQDPDYGKAVTKVGTGVNTGRYKSSIDPDRMVYTPLIEDNAYNALILGYKLPGNDGGESPAIPETGDRSMLSLYAALLLVSAGAYILMRKRGK